MLPLKRIAARDRRHAAIHEAGHVVMARHVGIECRGCSIVPSPPDDDLGKLWTGKTHFVSKPDDNAMRMIAVAGAVAEAVWKGEQFEPDDWYEPEQMSESDWSWAGSEPGNPSDVTMRAVQEAFDLFEPSRQVWAEVLETARGLIVESRQISIHTP